ncbi:MAG: hypothetical protein OCD02_23780 [Spirochaetaceae bacterium]
MIGFIIKKAFFDTWDNLLKFVVFNFMTIPFLFLAYLGLKIVSSGSLLGFAVAFIALIGVIIHQGTVAYFIKDIGNSIITPISEYVKYLKKDLSIKIKFAVTWSFFIIITSFSIFYYLNGQGMFSLIPLALVFWFSAMTSMAVLMFFPIKIRLEGSFKKVLKKCFIILLDNPLAGIFIYIYSIILLLLSLPSLGLLPPGLSSIACVLDTTVHMYDLKYTYLEENPDANRKKIPWRELTYELNENIGPRSLRGMIFPWKD